ncbi:DNA cytosine methyltransferase [Thiomicrorhabdus lithotrophica]|uniref:DNA (cytosine-5-)-methyltransferase n=1 Tax=Thiomicrorhabdus lithotrophica TaxID=2949997 RepID=A0ABY8C7E4_9GAMM|nr:DNA cytosine methyltransferase [Thiomicrorhabdus lithotrophica]WEJ61880.1 DNA cytosine methyltransferase [Thiomicrorhabdus lithotrophica]
MVKLRVIDFFCGAGGFSEGFRQEGFEVVMGIDFWQPAIDSHNLNHGLEDSVKDVMDFWGEDSGDVLEIDGIPDTEILIGSPSCVSFSMSNKAGKACKISGIQLILSFLRVICVKKHQKKSILQAWYLENVPQSEKFIQPNYTFSDLNLSRWARALGKKADDIAIQTKGYVLNAADYGAPQSRRRFIAGEFIETGEFPKPISNWLNHKTLGYIKSRLPSPYLKRNDNSEFVDPNYPKLKVKMSELTDHFYDTGLYKIEWEKAQHLKTNHPYMGKMSFPENEDRSCRTIMATRSASTRESLIFKSELNREENGEYRLPTIREAATLMGYPFVYQFTGTESTKWKQIGNSVSPHLSAALARAIKACLKGKTPRKRGFSKLKGNYLKIINLNSFDVCTFETPKTRLSNAKFRRHPVKLGNMTVDLQNFNDTYGVKDTSKWFVVAYFGTGVGHGVYEFKAKDFEVLESALKNNNVDLTMLNKYMHGLVEGLQGISLQELYETDLDLIDSNNPINIVKSIRIKSNEFYNFDELGYIKCDILPKGRVPVIQVVMAYALLWLINDYKDDSKKR